MTRSQAHRIERPTFLEISVALAGLTVAAVIVIGAGMFILTAFLSMGTYLQSVKP